MFNSLDQLEYWNNKKPIGEGAFSKVYKVKLKTENKIYALKEINISELSKGDRENLKDEIKIHKNINHDFIVKFYDVLQVFNFVYILWEYCELGSLFYYINEKSGMPEQIALKFFYQIATAINFLHEKNIIHRDIKPENVLITKDYKAKLCDFGWSTVLKNNLKTSICGTYEYMSPEIILEKPYDYKIDSWAIGILLYESVHGYPPYKASSIREIKDSIIQNDLEIKKDLSKTTSRMIKKLLKLNLKNRISSKEIFDQECYCDNKIFINGKLCEEDLSYFQININADFIHKKEELSILKYNKKIQSITVDDINHYIKNVEINNNLNNFESQNFSRINNKNNIVNKVDKEDKNENKKFFTKKIKEKEVNKNNTEAIKLEKNKALNKKKFEELKKKYNQKNNNKNKAINKDKIETKNKMNSKEKIETKNRLVESSNNLTKLDSLNLDERNKMVGSNNYLIMKNKESKIENLTKSSNMGFYNKNIIYNKTNKNNEIKVLEKNNSNLVNSFTKQIQYKNNNDSEEGIINHKKKLSNYTKMESLDNTKKDKNFNQINYFIKYNKYENKIDNKINNIYVSNYNSNYKNYNSNYNEKNTWNKNNSLKDIKNKNEKINYKYTIIEKLNGDIIKKYNDGKEEKISSKVSSKHNI